MMTRIMNTPGLEFYLDLQGRQGKSSSCLEVMLLYPLMTLAFDVPYSAFVNYFQISIQFGMKLCCEFGSAIKALYMCEFLRMPNDVNLRNITELHHDIHRLSGMLELLDCCRTKWKNCPQAWASTYQGKENKKQLILRELWTIICFFGIHHTDMLEHSMIKQYSTCPLFRNAFWMGLLRRESEDLG